MLRPSPCRWFELIASRGELAPLLEALARTGAVELQTHERHAAPWVIAGADGALERFHALARTYRSHWPEVQFARSVRIADPGATLAARVDQLEAWRAEADPLLADAERLESRSRALADLAYLLASDPGALPEPGLISSAGRFMVEARLYAMPAREPTPELPAAVLRSMITSADSPSADNPSGERFVVLVARTDDMAQADRALVARKARRISWPPDLQGDVPHAARQVAERRAALEQQRRELAAALEVLAQRHDLAAALSDIAVIEWLMRHGADLSASEHLVWVTGWTTAPDTTTFCDPLHRQGLRCVVQFAEPPVDAEPPSILRNPRWVRAFETFSRMLGQPGRDEADPSPLVALIAPLLFGFMFGDVGQGAVLCAAGWLLRRRVPMLLMLVPGGLMAMLFGLLFGSVFAREDLIPALWLHPLDHPIGVLGVAVGMGAAILLGGLMLGALQARWRSAGRAWWWRDAGLALAYAALLAGVVWREVLWLALAGAAWFVIGSAVNASAGRLAALGAGVAQFVEQGLQLIVNTVSFARVGAFALAHAGLSVAIVGVAEAAGSVGYWIVLALGNVLILVLEGLVVGIQTTRLLLFEFFVRFLKGTGRMFRPLPPPLVHHLQSTGSEHP